MFDWMLEELDNLLDPIGRDSFPGEPKELTDYRDILLATEYLTFVSKGEAAQDELFDLQK